MFLQKLVDKLVFLNKRLRFEWQLVQFVLHYVCDTYHHALHLNVRSLSLLNTLRCIFDVLAFICAMRTAQMFCCPDQLKVL
jgi:hypothetical protein